MKITWYGHSCFMIESSAGSVVIDPYSDGSVPGWQLPQLEAGLALCSHGHADHAGMEKVRLSGGASGYLVRTVPCFHDDEHGAKRGENIIHVVSAEGVSVAHLGDLGHDLSDADIAALGSPDVLLIPVGGHFTIDAAQAKRLADRIGARITVPMHYRGEGFGYDVIGPLDDFTRLCGDVVCAGASSFDPADYPQKVTLVLRAPK